MFQDFNVVEAQRTGDFSYQAFGFTEEEALSWADIGIEPAAAAYWGAYFSPTEAARWHKIGFPHPGEAAGWHYRGFSPDEAHKLALQGIQSWQAKK